MYQDLADLKAAVGSLNPAIKFFETSCFDGCYVTGDVTDEYLFSVENLRGEKSAAVDDGEDGQLDLNLVYGQDQ